MQNRINELARARLDLIGNKHTPTERTELETTLQQAVSEMENVRAQIRRASPRYAALMQSAQTLSLSALQTKTLDADTLLLEYKLGSERSFLWALTTSSFKMYEIAPRAKIEAAARRVYSLLSDYKTYHAEILDADGKPIWRSNALMPQTTSVSPFVPANALKNGDYLLKLYGQTAGGESAEVADYAFRVVRK